MKILNTLLKTSGSKNAVSDPEGLHAMMSMAWGNETALQKSTNRVSACPFMIIPLIEQKLPGKLVWRMSTYDQNFWINAKMYELQQNLFWAFFFQ